MATEADLSRLENFFGAYFQEDWHCDAENSATSKLCHLEAPQPRNSATSKLRHLGTSQPRNTEPLYSITASSSLIPLRISFASIAANPKCNPSRARARNAYHPTGVTSTPRSAAAVATACALTPPVNHPVVCNPASTLDTSSAPASLLFASSSKTDSRSAYTSRIRRTCRAKCPSLMNSRTTICSSTGAWRVVSDLTASTFSTSFNGTIRYASRSAGNKTLLKLPAYKTTPL